MSLLVMVCFYRRFFSMFFAHCCLSIFCPTCIFCFWLISIDSLIIWNEKSWNSLVSTLFQDIITCVLHRMWPVLDNLQQPGFLRCIFSWFQVAEWLPGRLRGKLQLCGRRSQLQRRNLLGAWVWEGYRGQGSKIRLWQSICPQHQMRLEL